MVGFALGLCRWSLPISTAKIRNMASLEQRGKSFLIIRFKGQRFTRCLRTRDEKVATAALHRLEDNLRRVELGTLTVPESLDPADFLLADGTRPSAKPY